jgi:CIC family chloride channel protein
VELTRKGIEIHAGREIALMSSIKVRDVMFTDFITVGENTLLDEIIYIMVKYGQFYLPVLNKAGEMLGIVSIQDVRPALFEDRTKRVVTAKQIATEDLITLKPGDDLNTAMAKFTLKDIDELPVVDEFNPKRIVAMLRRKDIMAAYNKEVLRKRTT